MNNVIIFGNSGAGKSSLAKAYATQYGLSHLDLDTLAWEKTIPPKRKLIEESLLLVNQFRQNNPSWVLEGGYSGLLSAVLEHAEHIVFLNPGVDVCVQNCRNRPWEPHKYESASAQDKNLNMLIEWVKEYPIRNDDFSLASHQHLFDAFSGDKVEYKSNERDHSWA